MNENVLITIQPVHNGFIVQLPFVYPDQWDGLKKVMPGHDAMLEEKKDEKEMSKTEHVFIFSTFEEVLSFLAKKYVTK